MNELLENTLKSYLKSYPYGIPAEVFQDALSAEQDSPAVDFVFLVKYQDQAKEVEFLQAIIEKGLKLSMEDVLIVDDLSTQCFESEFIVCFGEEAFNLLGERAEYQSLINTVTDIAGHECLVTNTMSELMNDKDAKKNFWKELQQYA